MAVLGEMYYRENDGFRDFNGPVDGSGIYRKSYGNDDAGGLMQVAPMIKVLWQAPTKRDLTFELKASYNGLDYNEGYTGLTKADFNVDPYQRYVVDEVNRQAAMKENQLRTAIRQAYYSDQLQLQEGPQMTATEVQVRYELMQRLLGPTLGRFQSEFLNPLIERVFGIMYRAGALMKEPDIIQGTKIDVEYLGPLARSQRMEESVAIERLYSLAMNIAQIDPAIMDNIDHDEAVRLRGKLLGVPKTVLRGRDEVEGMREAKAQAQQDMMQQQNTQPSHKS